MNFVVAINVVACVLNVFALKYGALEFFWLHLMFIILNSCVAARHWE